MLEGNAGSAQPARRQRSSSISIESPRPSRAPMLDDDQDSDNQPNEPATTPQISRSVSLSCVRMHTRECDDPRFRITYHDETLCQLSLDNVRRLLRAAKEPASSEESKHGNNVRLAKKALQYRRLLRRAQAVDTEDPHFDLNAFLHITWCKAEPEPSGD